MRNQRKAGVKGITLIALVITIVILIILAVISMNAIFGEKGIISRVKDAASKNAGGQIEENFKLGMLDSIIGAYTGDISDIIKPLEEFGVKGLYKIKINIEIKENNCELERITGEADSIIENEGKLYRATLILNISPDNFDIQISNAEEVLTVEDKAKVFIAIFKAIEGEEDPDLEMVDNSIVKYKGKLYQIVMNQINDTQIEVYIDDFEILNTDDKTWKKVYTSYEDAIAVDAENNVWLWRVIEGNNSYVSNLNSITPICINRNSNIEIVDIMNSGDYNTHIMGLVDSNGKLYTLNRYDTRLTHLTDKFQSQIGNIVAKKAYWTTRYVREISGNHLSEIYIIDENNKSWLLGFDEIYNTLFYKICLNDEISDWSGVQIDSIGPIWNSQNHYFIDTNKKLWAFNIEDYRIPSKDTIRVECLSNNIELPLYGKKIKKLYTSEYNPEFIAIDEEGVLYEYDKYENTIIKSTDRDDMREIKVGEYIEYIGWSRWNNIILDTNGNLWEYVSYSSYIEDNARNIQLNTNGGYNNNKIKYISTGVIIDVENNIWYLNTIIGNLRERTIKEISGKSVFMIIDNEGKLYKGGNFIILR